MPRIREPRSVAELFANAAQIVVEVAHVEKRVLSRVPERDRLRHETHGGSDERLVRVLNALETRVGQAHLAPALVAIERTPSDHPAERLERPKHATDDRIADVQ